MISLSRSACERYIEFISSFKHNRNKHFLTRYQEIIVNYFKSSAFRDKQLLLLFMEVGTGKTLTSLACGIEGLKSGEFKKIVILSPKAVQDEFERNLEMYYKFSGQPGYKQTREKIVMIPYNANNSQEQFRKLGNLEDTLFIIDEAHLFMKSVIKTQIAAPKKPSKSSAKKTRKTVKKPHSKDDRDSSQTAERNEEKPGKNVGNSKNIYDMINGLKHKKVICLTGTPSSKHPFETVPIFNLAGCNLPNTFDEFNREYVDDIRGEIKNRRKLIDKIKGMVAFVASDAKSQNLKVSSLEEINVEMSVPQYKQYLIDYKKELDEKGFTNKKNVYGLLFGAKSSFHAKTFEDSIYWNDSLTNRENDKNRYPGTIQPDMQHCPKVIRMFNDSLKFNGPCVFYFRFVRMYGTDTMEAVLRKNGYRLVKPNEDVFQRKEKRYVLFTGNVPNATRVKWKKLFNDRRNMYGEYIKYLILSPSGSVGVTLRNVRFLGIGSVEFNYSSMRQILGRVNRLNSHINLPEKDRKLTNRLYISEKNMKYYSEHKKEIDKLCSRTTYKWNQPAPTIERIIYQDSIHDDIINESFRLCLMEASIL